MQAYFEPEQAFSISMPQPVFEVSIAYKEKDVMGLCFFKTHSTVYDEKRWQDELKRRLSSHTGIVTLAERLLVS